MYLLTYSLVCLVHHIYYFFFFTFRTLTLFQVDTVSITHIFNSIFTKQLCIYIFLIFFRYILFARGGKSSHILYSNRSNKVQAL